MQVSTGIIGQLDPNKPIHIIGGGVAGLFIAYYLKKAQIPFTLYEQSDRVGGKIQTIENEFGLNEQAANAIFANDDVYDFLDELNLDYIPSNKKLKKLIWNGDKIISPFSLVFSILLRLPFLLRKPLVNESTSIYSFFSPLLGKKLTATLLSPIFAGIYAEDITELHFKSIFKTWNNQQSYLEFFKSLKKARKEQRHKPQSLSFKGGMQSLINHLEDDLSEHIKVSTTVDLDTLENVIICTDAKNAAKLLYQYPEISECLNHIEYNSLSTATLITAKPMTSLKKAFGVLFPPREKQIKSFGILANSEIFTRRVNKESYNSYTFILKSSLADESQINSDLQKLQESSLSSEKLSLLIKSWPLALPKYDENRFRQILKLRSLLLNTKKDIALFGNYIDGISLREILSHAKNFASKLH